MRKNKVAYFKLLLGTILAHTKIVIGCMIIAITVLIAPVVYGYVITIIETTDFDASPFVIDLISGFILSLLPIAYGFIAHVSKNWNRNISNFKRLFYRKCLQIIKSDRTPKIISKIAELMIHVFYYQRRTVILEQQNTVNQILDGMKISDRQKVFWIQGSPYSGKTMTVLNLFVDLISKKEYADLFTELDGRMLYVDLARDDFNAKDLLYAYRSGKYEKYLVVLDNLHKVAGSVCIDIINQVVVHSQAYAIIVLMRNPEDFLCDSERITFLKNTIQNIGTRFTLSAMSSTDFGVYSEDLFRNFCAKFGLYDYNNNAMIVHLSSLYLRSKLDKRNALEQVCQFLNNNALINRTNKMLAAIISASLFTGSFSIQALQTCENYSESMWRAFLKHLLNIGFLINYPTSTTQYYYFHETLAKFYFQKSYIQPAYQRLYNKYFKALCSYYSNHEHGLFAYLYTVLQGKEKDAIISFDEILVNANFINLYNEMEFLLSQDEAQRCHYYRELGMLCDRIGKLGEAKKYYMKYLHADHSPDAFFKLLQIDHDYMDQYPSIVRQAYNDKDCYYRFLARYWIHHIQMHKGNFDFIGFSKLVEEAQRETDAILNSHTYDGIHLLRRLYFDCFRIYYLSGTLDPTKLLSIVSQNSHLKQTLQTRLDEFEAYYFKFAVGQFLAQDVLFSLAFLSSSVDRECYQAFIRPYTNLQYEEMHNAEKIAEEAIKQYKKAIKKMERIGDKTAIFIRYHMYDLKLSLIHDGNYSECEQFYEDYMRFATREDDIEYQSYAELYKLKMLLVKANSVAIIADAPDYEDILKQIKKRIQITGKYQELCNDNENTYAALRLSLYKVVFKFMIGEITQVQFKDKVLLLRRIAMNKNYHREMKLFNYIERYQFNPSREQLRIIISYYPIITQ